MWRLAFFALPLTGMTLVPPPEFNERTTEGNSVEEFRLREWSLHFQYVFLIHGSDRWYGHWETAKGSKDRSPSRNPYLNIAGVPFSVPEEDAILPIYGRLYRVSGNPKDFTSRTFTLIKKDALPAGLDIEKDSMVVPLERDGVGYLGFSLSGNETRGSLKISIDKIVSRDDRMIAHGTAVINLISGQNKTVALKLREGEELPIDQRVFTVRRIIPKDYKGTKTVGWVELGVEGKR